MASPNVRIVDPNVPRSSFPVNQSTTPPIGSRFSCNLAIIEPALAAASIASISIPSSTLFENLTIASPKATNCVPKLARSF